MTTTRRYNIVCAIGGGAGIVWGTNSEDDREGNDDDIDGPARLGTVWAALEGEQLLVHVHIHQLPNFLRSSG